MSTTNPTQVSLFCGREKDLAHLQETWQKAKDGKPQVVVLLAESGLGKTRLVQEFYNWLSVTDDGIGDEGYWPDILTQKDKNLEVNPEVTACNDAINMPYLWWAIRLNPIGRNQHSTSISAVNSYKEQLVLHLENLSKGFRTYIDTFGKTLKNAGKDAIVDEFPGSTVLKLGFELVQNARVLRSDKKVSIEERSQQNKNDLTEQITNDLRKVLEKRKGMKTIPAVIVIDDAHFSTKFEDGELIPQDSTLIELTDKLVSTALREKWPVMFIFTHWKREWNEHIKSAQASIAIRVNVLCRDNFENWKPYQITAITGNILLPVLRKQLTGLTSDQEKNILNRAYGNPLFLEEIIRYCKNNERHFENRSIENQLSENGFIEVMKVTKGGIFELFAERFENSPSDIKRILAISSVQGMWFLPIISSDLVKEITIQHQLILAKNACETLEKAEDPYAFLASKIKGLTEFSQRVFYEVAFDNIENFIDFPVLQDSLRVVLRKYATQYDLFEKLSNVETIFLLELIGLNLEKSNNRLDHNKALQAWVELLKITFSGAEFQSAFNLAKHIFQGCENKKWKLSDIAFNDLMSLLDTLQKMNDYDSAKIVAFELLSQSKTQHDFAISHSRIGYVLQIQGDLVEGLFHSEKALEIGEKLTKTTEVERDLSIFYSNIGDIHIKQSNFDAALKNFKRGFEIFQNRAQQLQTAQAKRDLHLAYIRIGDTYSHLDDLSNSIENYQKGLQLCEQLTLELPTSETLRDLYISYERIGTIQQKQGDLNNALESYQKGLVINSSLLDYQATPETFRGLSLCLHRIGDIQFRQYDYVSALENHYQGLAINKYLVEQSYTPELLHNLSNSYGDIGVVQQAQNNFSDALESFEAGLEIKKELTKLLQSPTTLHGLRVSYMQIANLQQMMGEFSSAVQNFQKGLEISNILENQLNTLSEKQNLSEVYYFLADVLALENDLVAALENYQKSLEIKTILLTEFNIENNLYVLYSIIGDIQFKLGDFDLALKSYGSGLEISVIIAQQLKTYDAYENITNFHRKIAKTYNANNEFSEALGHYQKVIEINENLVIEIDSIEAFNMLYSLYSEVIDVLIEMDDLIQALQYCQSFIEVAKKLQIKLNTNESLRNLAYAHNITSNVQYLRNDNLSAIANLKTGLEITMNIIEQVDDPNIHRDLAISYYKLSNLSNELSSYLQKALKHSLEYQKTMPCDDSDNLVNIMRQQLKA